MRPISTGRCPAAPIEWAIVGVSEGSMWSFVHTPFWCGWRPVSIDIRDGTQIGEVQ